MGRKAHMLGWTLGAAAGAVLVGIAVGVVAGLAFGLAGPARDGWEDLAAFATGLVLGLGAAGVAWFVLFSLVVRRFVREGRRVAVWLWSLPFVVGVPLAVWLVLGATGLVGGGDLTQVTLLVAVVTALVAPPAVMVVRDGGPQPV
jgi:membrane protease YdiL (CAAX protease family)